MIRGSIPVESAVQVQLRDQHSEPYLSVSMSLFISYLSASMSIYLYLSIWHKVGRHIETIPRAASVLPGYRRPRAQCAGAFLGRCLQVHRDP